MILELNKKIDEVKNERQRLKNDIEEQRIKLRVREAELCVVESFIDVLNDLKKKN